VRLGRIASDMHDHWSARRILAVGMIMEMGRTTMVQEMNHVLDTWPIVVSPPHRKSWPACWKRTRSVGGEETNENIRVASVPCLHKCSSYSPSAWRVRREGRSIERGVERTMKSTWWSVDARIEEEPDGTSRSRLRHRAMVLEGGEGRWEE
jgi:hypothetical protein